MKTPHVGLMILALGLLSSCWYGSYPGPPQPPITKIRPCTGNDFVSPFVQTSRSKAKLGDSIVLVGLPGSFQPVQNYDSAQNTYTQPDLNTCPKVKLIRFLIGDVVVGEVASEPYRLSITLKAGEKGIPASSATIAGTTVDVVISAQTVYTDDKASQPSVQYGPGPVPAFFSIEYP